MKKVYICPNCNQYHPESNKHDNEHLSKSKQALRFSDLFVGSRFQAGNSKVQKEPVAKQIRIPKAHPENMTVSSINHKHHWDKNNKSNKNNKSSIIKVKNPKRAVEQLKLFKNKHSKYSQSKASYHTPSRFKNQNQNKSKNLTAPDSIINSQISQLRTGQNLHLDSTGKVSQLSRSFQKQNNYFSILHSSQKRSQNKMAEDYDKDEVQEKDISFGVNPNYEIKSKLNLSSSIHESKLIEDKFDQIVVSSDNNKNDKLCRQSQLYVNEKRIDYAQEMENLRKILKENQSRAQLKVQIQKESIKYDQEQLDLKMIKIGEKYYFKEIRNSSALHKIRDYRCCGLNIEEDGQLQLLQVPEMYL